MGPLHSHRRTVLFALGLAALVAVVAAPGAAQQTERVNQSLSTDSNADYLITYQDTGNTTLMAANDSGTILQSFDAGNITGQQYSILDGNPPSATRIIISSERPGVTYRAGNLTASPSDSAVGSPLRYETRISEGTNATLLTTSGTDAAEMYNAFDYIDSIDSDRNTTTSIPVNRSADGVGIEVFVGIDDNRTSQDPQLVQRLLNRSLTPGESVEAFRVMQSNSAPVERARARIISDGTTLINESLPDAQTSVGYGAVALDNISEYRVTVTGVENDSDGQSPSYEISKLKPNSPLIAINPADADSDSMLLALGLGFVAVLMYLRTRD